MDKKNTMLLTVIAVATLLVAVVGATFAYFSISANATNNAETTVTGATAKVGTVTLSADKSPRLTLAATDFANTSDAKKAYYSTESGTPGEKADQTPVVKGSVSNSDTAVTYSCTASLNVSVDGIWSGEESATNDLATHTEEAVLTIGGLNNATVDSQTSKDIDLANITKSQDPLTLAFKLTGADTTDKGLVYASLMIKNTEGQQQGYLAGRTITTTVTVTNINCSPVAE